MTLVLCHDLIFGSMGLSIWPFSHRFSAALTPKSSLWQSTSSVFERKRSEHPDFLRLVDCKPD